MFAPAGVDAVSGTATYDGLWFWTPQMYNRGPSDPGSPSISLDTVGSQWTQPLQPLPAFPIVESFPDFPVGTNFPFSSVYSSIQPVPMGFRFGFFGPASTGFDASRELASPANDVVPSGGTTQTWLLTMTLRDPALAGAQIIVQLDPTSVGGSVDGPGVTTPVLGDGESPVFFQTSGGRLAWSIWRAVVGKPYTLSVPVNVPNPGGAFTYKPSVYFQASPPQSSFMSTGTSVAITDSVLGGTFTYSVGQSATWWAGTGQSFETALGQVGPTPVNRPPVCNAATASPETIWPPNGKDVPVSIVGVTDPDGDPVTIAATGISMNEPGPVAGAVSGAGAVVKAERDGAGNGRVYTVAFTATDDKHASCTGSVTVAVPHDQRTQ